MSTTSATVLAPPAIPFEDCKRENLRCAVQLLTPGRPAAPVTSRPLLLHLEITSRCNLRCAKCGHATDPIDSPRIQPRNLPYGVIETFDEYFAAAVRVHTFGYGEMFLYNKLKQLVQRLKHYGCTVDGISNGVLVDKEEVDWLVDYGYDEITFSIDGVKPETMQRLRGVDVEKIWNMLGYLKQRKQETGKKNPRVIVNFVAQSDNYQELPDLVRKLIDYDIYFMGVNPLMPDETIDRPGKYAALYREFSLANAPREDVERVLNETRELAAPKFGFWAYIDLDSLYASRYGAHRASGKDGLLQILPDQHLDRVQQGDKLLPYYCSYPWTSMYVHADSGARVCCYMDGSLGKVTDAESMQKVWTEGPIVEIRDAISKGEVHRFCQYCVGLGRYQHSYQELDEMKRLLGV
jgi:MoaA/NifB/PqqE/SkfB family radical SAM enzyme